MPSISPLKIAKINKLHALLEKDEIRDLLFALNKPSFFRTAKMSRAGAEKISSDEFIELYSDVLSTLKEGGGITPKLMDIFSLSMSRHGTSYAEVVQDGRVLLRPIVPVIQLSPTFIRYSKEDGSFRFGLYGKEASPLGITFSYPQLFQDSESKEVLRVDQGEKFPDTELFFSLWRWLRESTTVASFFVDGKKTNVPIRMGKTCFTWVNQIHGIKEQGINIERPHAS